MTFYQQLKLVLAMKRITIRQKTKCSFAKINSWVYYERAGAQGKTRETADKLLSRGACLVVDEWENHLHDEEKHSNVHGTENIKHRT